MKDETTPTTCLGEQRENALRHASSDIRAWAQSITGRTAEAPAPTTGPRVNGRQRNPKFVREGVHMGDVFANHQQTYVRHRVRRGIDPAEAILAACEHYNISWPNKRSEA